MTAHWSWESEAQVYVKGTVSDAGLEAKILSDKSFSNAIRGSTLPSWPVFSVNDMNLRLQLLQSSFFLLRRGESVFLLCSVGQVQADSCPSEQTGTNTEPRFGGETLICPGRTLSVCITDYTPKSPEENALQE